MNAQGFWLKLFFTGAGIMILHSVLSITSIDADLQPLGLALVAVAIVPLYQSESTRKRAKREEEVIEILGDIRESLAK